MKAEILGLAPIFFCPATVVSYFTEKINNFNKHQWARAWCLVGLSTCLVYQCVYLWAYVSPVHICAWTYTSEYVNCCINRNIVWDREIDRLMNSKRGKRTWGGEGFPLVPSDQIFACLKGRGVSWGQLNWKTDGWRKGMEQWMVERNHFWSIVNSQPLNRQRSCLEKRP